MSNCSEDSEDIKWKNFLLTVFKGMNISPLFDKKIINFSDLNKALQMIMKKKINVCGQCGCSIDDIIKTGKAGCPACYELLNPEINHIVSQCHNGQVKHVGKRPKNHMPRPEDSIEALEAKMEEAVNEERYEDATKIRDAIKNRKSL